MHYSFGKKWKTGAVRQYITDIIGLSSTTNIIGLKICRIRWKNANAVKPKLKFIASVFTALSRHRLWLTGNTVLSKAMHATHTHWPYYGPTKGQCGCLKQVTGTLLKWICCARFLYICASLKIVLNTVCKKIFEWYGASCSFSATNELFVWHKRLTML